MFNIQTTIDCGFNLKFLRDMKKTSSQMRCKDKYSHLSSIIWCLWSIGLVFVYEQNDCVFETNCSYLNFRFRSSFEQGDPQQTTKDCGFNLKFVSGRTKTYSQVPCKDKYSNLSSIICLLWSNGWMFVEKVTGCQFETNCSYLNFRLPFCFEQRDAQHSDS